ncbi:unnamed protein product [Absidia cylindrospora]
MAFVHCGVNLYGLLFMTSLSLSLSVCLHANSKPFLFGWGFSFIPFPWLSDVKKTIKGFSLVVISLRDPLCLRSKATVLISQKTILDAGVVNSFLVCHLLLDPFTVNGNKR